VQIIEVWAIDTFRKMEKTYAGTIPVMSYLQQLATKLNGYYVEAKNSLLRIESDLNLVDEEPVDPKTVDTTSLEKALEQAGFNDAEDISHIACLMWLKQNRGIKPIFATVDRKLYECKDIIYQETQVIVEDALYAAGTYASATSRSWPVTRSSKK